MTREEEFEFVGFLSRISTREFFLFNKYVEEIKAYVGNSDLLWNYGILPKQSGVYLVKYKQESKFKTSVEEFDADKKVWSSLIEYIRVLCWKEIREFPELLEYVKKRYNG